MITSFADFVYNRRNTLYQLAILIYKRDGYYGFTIGLVREKYRLLRGIFLISSFGLVSGSAIGRRIVVLDIFDGLH